MKLIIDIDEDYYKKIVKLYYENPFPDKRNIMILNGIPLPDNATNGDVLKAMFPNIITDEFATTIHATTKVVSNGVKGSISYDFWKDWWNASYKAESESEE